MAMGVVWPRPTAGARKLDYDVRRTREPECPPIHAGEVSRIRGTGAIRYSLISEACALGKERTDLRFGRVPFCFREGDCCRTRTPNPFSALFGENVYEI